MATGAELGPAIDFGPGDGVQVALRVWETVYNTIRPHQALGSLTPADYLASVGIDV